MINSSLLFADQRVVLFTPTGRDAPLTAALLTEKKIASVTCNTIRQVEDAVSDPKSVLLIAEEALTKTGISELSTVLTRQPVWSDLPILLLTRYGADSPMVSLAVNALGNVTLLERPVRPATLISALRGAMKARIRQQQVGEQVAEQARSNAVLEVSIREREKAEAALRDADRRKDEFLATLAHELRNPLAPIQNSLHILRLANTDNPASEKVCEMMERQMGHLIRLVDDLMEVSRITRGNIELQREPVELAAVIRNSVDESRALIERQGHTLSISIPHESIVIDGDPLRLCQIFTNLLNNAAKYMENGGHIWIVATRKDSTIRISIKDTGVGIAADMLPQIFKMFTQVDRSSRLSQGGLGIGLTLVKTLTELHGGRVEVQSAGVGLGSEFIVLLPVVSAAQTERKKQAVRPSSLPNRRVMVVDDNRDAGESLGMLLSILGVETKVVSSGEMALREIDAFQPTVMILDIGMPGMDGCDLAKRIRAKPEWRDVLLIALTGWGQEEDRLKTAQAGFDHHLVKPADVNSLQTLFMTIGTGT